MNDFEKKINEIETECEDAVETIKYYIGLIKKLSETNYSISTTIVTAKGYIREIELQQKVLEKIEDECKIVQELMGINASTKELYLRLQVVRDKIRCL